MANKLLLEDEAYGDAYEPSDSENEYSEEEKELLEKVRKGNRKELDSKQELLAFDEDESADDDGGEDDIIEDSDIERGDEDRDIPDAKAWGKQRRSYYNTDFVDQDYSTYNEKEEEQAQQEEQEARAIQQRLAKQLDEADFFLDIEEAAATTPDSDNEEQSAKSDLLDGTKLKTDLGDLSKRQKLQLFHKDSPEYAGLVADFELYLGESQRLLSPIEKYASAEKLQLPAIDFAQMQNNIILTYCTNINFYLLLKAKRIPVKYHPITKRLVQLRKLLLQLQEKYENVVKPQLEELLQRIQSGEKIMIDAVTTKKTKKSKLGILKSYENQEESNDLYEMSSKRDQLAAVSSDDDTDNDLEETDKEEKDAEDEEDDEEQRRGITYQIAKNKGLMPYRKKELRNPRVKHRGKFRKALIRRKGAVRTVRKENKRYGGEVSGIKATTKKGIKIKS